MTSIVNRGRSLQGCSQALARLICPSNAPAKFQLVVNLKTARTLGIDVPRPLLLLADEVIE